MRYLIRTIGALNAGALLPEESLFSRLLKRSKELTAASTEKLLQATEQAREKARPYTDKAMEAAREGAEQAKGAAERASDAAKPYVDKSKEAAQKAYDDAMKMAKELIEQKPQSPPKNDRRAGCGPVGWTYQPTPLRPALATAPVERLAVCPCSTPLALPTASPSSPEPPAASAVPSPWPTPGRAPT